MEVEIERLCQRVRACVDRLIRLTDRLEEDGTHDVGQLEGLGDRAVGILMRARDEVRRIVGEHGVMTRPTDGSARSGFTR